MNDILFLALSLITGVALGVIFFGGLWWTVRKGTGARRPALWFAASLLLRTGIVLAGFYFLGRGDWMRMAACLVGFIAARLLVMRLTRPAEKTQSTPGKEAGREPQS
jgi:F1F0 ATPase subunit 2